MCVFRPLFGGLFLRFIDDVRPGGVRYSKHYLTPARDYRLEREGRIVPLFLFIGGGQLETVSTGFPLRDAEEETFKMG